MSVSQGSGGSPKRPVKRPVLHHVNFKTTRLQEMIDWYSNTVGIEVMFQNEAVAFTSNDAANHRIALISSPLLSDDANRVVHTGVHHVAFEYATVDDLLETWVRLSDQGTLPHMSLDHGLTLTFYYVDPDGRAAGGLVWRLGEIVGSHPDVARVCRQPNRDVRRSIQARRRASQRHECRRTASQGLCGRIPGDDAA